MLLSRPYIHDDESVESYIIRLSEANGFSVRQFVDIYFKEFESFEEFDKTTPPLKLINLNHGKCKIKERILFFESIASAAKQDKSRIFNNLVKRADSDNLQFSKYICNGVEIPAFLFRKESVPVCPICLADSAYIRQYWHVAIVHCCPKHKVALLKSCPSCKRPISYLNNERITSCPCGYSLIQAALSQLNKNYDELLLSLGNLVYISMVNQTSRNKLCKLPSENIYTIFGLAVFYFRYLGKISHLPSDPTTFFLFLDFVKEWPNGYIGLLSDTANKGLRYLIKPSNETDFKSVFGNLINNIQYLPNSSFKDNLIMKETYDFFQQRIFVDKRNGKKDTISNLLLTKDEVASLLGVSTARVAKLTSEGKLYTKRQTLKTYIGTYSFGEVFDLWSEKRSAMFNN